MGVTTSFLGSAAEEREAIAVVADLGLEDHGVVEPHAQLRGDPLDRGAIPLARVADHRSAVCRKDVRERQLEDRT